MKTGKLISRQNSSDISASSTFLLSFKHLQQRRHHQRHPIPNPHPARLRTRRPIRRLHGDRRGSRRRTISSHRTITTHHPASPISHHPREELRRVFINKDIVLDQRRTVGDALDLLLRAESVGIEDVAEVCAFTKSANPSTTAAGDQLTDPADLHSRTPMYPTAPQRSKLHHQHCRYPAPQSRYLC